jgi:adenylylsulfate kinase
MPAAPTAPARTVWLTGLPSAGKTTLAHALADRLRLDGRAVEVLDGDAVREGLTAGLGFSRADRDENVRRIGFVADLLSRNGVWALCSVISPYRRARDEVRARHLTSTPHDPQRFVEAWVATPVEVCAQRDVKGLYARQARGDLVGLTGVDDAYEEPQSPDVVVRTHELSLAECVELLWSTATPELVR